MKVSLRDGETLADYAFRVTAERDEARAELARVRDRAWAAESALTHRYALRREIEILLGIDPGAASDEAFQAGVNAVKRLTAERDRALALLRKTRTHAPLGTHRWATLLAEIDALLSEEDR